MYQINTQIQVYISSLQNKLELSNFILLIII